MEQINGELKESYVSNELEVLVEEVRILAEQQRGTYRVYIPR